MFRPRQDKSWLHLPSFFSFLFFSFSSFSLSNLSSSIYIICFYNLLSVFSTFEYISTLIKFLISLFYLPSFTNMTSTSISLHVTSLMTTPPSPRTDPFHFIIFLRATTPRSPSFSSPSRNFHFLLSFKA